MIKKTLKRIALTFAAVAALAAPVAMPAVAFAQTASPSTANIEGSLCAGANLDVTNQNCADINQTTAQTKINQIIARVINIFSFVVAIIAIIMIIIGGIKYITSGGDSGNVTGAKNTILYAIIGLVVVALSQFIVRFVLARVSGA